MEAEEAADLLRSLGWTVEPPDPVDTSEPWKPAGEVGQILASDLKPKPVPAATRVICTACHRALQNVYYVRAEPFGRICFTRQPAIILPEDPLP